MVYKIKSYIREILINLKFIIKSKPVLFIIFNKLRNVSPKLNKQLKQFLDGSIDTLPVNIIEDSESIMAKDFLNSIKSEIDLIKKERL